MQATIDDVQEAGLLGAVFTHLESLEDKTWLFTWQNMRPVSLVIPGSKPQVDYMGVMQVLRWVQHKQQKGHMQVRMGFPLSLNHGTLQCPLSVHSAL